MSDTDERERDLRRELAGWFAANAPRDDARDVIEAALDKTAAVPQRRSLASWVAGLLPRTTWSRPRTAWSRPLVLLLSVAVLLSAWAGLALLGRPTGRPTAPAAAAPAPAAPTPTPVATPATGRASPTASPFSPGPYIYWANNGLSTIGRATLDGRAVQENFIRGADWPCGVAVDASHIYWANAGDGAIGRANLDGTGVDEHFITGATSPCGLAVDGTHIYWANGGAASPTADGPSPFSPHNVPRTTHATTIGRANLDGSGVDQGFISGADDPCGIAVDAGHIYWANPGNVWPPPASNSRDALTIGRANLDGSGVEQRFITGAGMSCGVAVDRAHLYWANQSDLAIGRANVDGSAAKPAWLPATANGACGVAVADNHLYWANQGGVSISRSNLDGSGVEFYFVDTSNTLGVPYACGVAVGP